MLTIAAVACGFALDALLGDPRRIPHPVVAMGRAIAWLEPRLRTAFPDSPAGRRRAGVVLVAILCAGSFGISAAFVLLAGWLNPALGCVVEAWLCYQALAACELRRQSMRVVRALADGGLPAARKAVGMIVGRDTAELDEEGVLKASVETVAENTADGVVAPLVYLMVGGAPLGMLYKAVNTMDSMVGYKNDRYIDFGRAAARVDDALGFIPSRFAALCMVVAAPLAGLSAKGAWRIWRRDRFNHASPNSAQTESAMAGALGVRLAGDAVYFGKLVKKPTMGDSLRPIERSDVARANRMMTIASVLALAVSGMLRAAIVATVFALI
ncbi:MAG: adenosylcobinamide-phosphate synthase CbiB [Eggerthellaceae bacterium]|nr:adenosylcobinamide-phosphate synthase CbiB [Eggerthellaceae bacterium]